MTYQLRYWYQSIALTKYLQCWRRMDYTENADEKIMFLVFALFSSCVTVYTDTAVRNLVGGRKEEEKEITEYWDRPSCTGSSINATVVIVCVKMCLSTCRSPNLLPNICNRSCRVSEVMLLPQSPQGGRLLQANCAASRATHDTVCQSHWKASLEKVRPRSVETMWCRPSVKTLWCRGRRRFLPLQCHLLNGGGRHGNAQHGEAVARSARAVKSSVTHVRWLLTRPPRHFQPRRALWGFLRTPPPPPPAAVITKTSVLSNLRPGIFLGGGERISVSVLAQMLVYTCFHSWSAWN